jgi:hypothetical protein
MKVQKDDHVEIGGHRFHFLNAKDQPLSGEVTFALVDKSFVSSREFKKYASMTRMACVQTGRMEKCCAKNTSSAETERIFHVII